MREIKFRGRRQQGCWYYGSLDLTEREPKICFQDTITDEDSGEVCPFTRRVAVDTDTIGQFTGLTDRKGTEIYEGDIVRVSTRMKHDVKEATENLSDMIGIQPPKWVSGGDEIARVSYFDGAFHFIFMESFMPNGVGRQEPMLHYLFGERHPDAAEYFNTEIEVIGNIHDDKIKEE